MIHIDIDKSKASKEELEELAKFLKLGDKKVFTAEGRAKARKMNIIISLRNGSNKKFKQ